MMQRTGLCREQVQVLDVVEVEDEVDVAVGAEEAEMLLGSDSENLFFVNEMMLINFA